MRIRKGLIIADPWIGYILDGQKTWEMRSSGASHRGCFGLIRKGTGAVYGVARLVDVGAPLSPTEMIETMDRHRIPEYMIRSGVVAKWNTPWKLADVSRLAKPVPYRHRSGAVTWIELDPDVSDAIERQLQGDVTSAVVAGPAQAAVSKATGNSKVVDQVELSVEQTAPNRFLLTINTRDADAVPGEAAGEGVAREEAAQQTETMTRKPSRTGWWNRFV